MINNRISKEKCCVCNFLIKRNTQNCLTFICFYNNIYLCETDSNHRLLRFRFYVQTQQIKYIDLIEFLY
jgi:hypothetical protein